MPKNLFLYFSSLLSSKGILHQSTCLHTPQQKGKADIYLKLHIPYSLVLIYQDHHWNAIILNLFFYKQNDIFTWKWNSSFHSSKWTFHISPLYFLLCMFCPRCVTRLEKAPWKSHQMCFSRLYTSLKRVLSFFFGN